MLSLPEKPAPIYRWTTIRSPGKSVRHGSKWLLPALFVTIQKIHQRGGSGGRRASVPRAGSILNRQAVLLRDWRGGSAELRESDMSDLSQFRSKGSELLVELVQHISKTIREIIDIEPAIVDQASQVIANRVMQVWGGWNVYFPTDVIWKVSQHDREIFREFNGRSHHELARKFGVSSQRVYNVVKRIRKEELDRMQDRLFGGNLPEEAKDVNKSR